MTKADVIYRQDAIDMMVEILADATTCMMPKDLWREVVTERISKLPSAHPDIIRCKDCKHYQGEDSWFHCNRVTWLNGEDDFCSRAERKDNE